MKLSNIFFLSALFLLTTHVDTEAQEASKIDITGTWDIIARRERSVLTIKHDNGKFSGMHKSRAGEFPITNVKVERNVLSYDMPVEMSGRSLLIQVKSHLENNDLSGVMEFGWQDAITMIGKKRVSNKKIEDFKDLIGEWTFTTIEGEGLLTFSIKNGVLTCVFENEEATIPVDFIDFTNNRLMCKINYTGADGNREITILSAIEGKKMTGFIEFSWKNALSFTAEK